MDHDHNTSGMTDRHGLIMLLCCLILLAAIVSITLLEIPVNSVLFVGLLLLCPLSHILLMRGTKERVHGSASQGEVGEGDLVSQLPKAAE